MNDVRRRQIRTIIRLALALAKTEGVPVNKTHLERTIKVALQFAADLEKAFE
jgi:DNA replicative helicase MCM subunit Mcm2 (Cdc46/Mcm family)